MPGFGHVPSAPTPQYSYLLTEGKYPPPGLNVAMYVLGRKNQTCLPALTLHIGLSEDLERRTKEKLSHIAVSVPHPDRILQEVWGWYDAEREGFESGSAQADLKCI